MLQLFSSGGSSSLQVLSNTYSAPEMEEELIFNACQLLAIRGETEAASYLATFSFDGTNNFNDEFCILSTRLSLTQYEFLRSNMEHDAPNRKEFRALFSTIASTISEIGPHIRFIICHLDQVEPPENWRNELSQSIATLGTNQALFTFKDSSKIVHEGLNFRSKTEIRIFDTLVNRGLLIFPLPVAVLAKQRAYKEPDFVVCYKGRFGIKYMVLHGIHLKLPLKNMIDVENSRNWVSMSMRYLMLTVVGMILKEWLTNS